MWALANSLFLCYHYYYYLCCFLGREVGTPCVSLQAKPSIRGAQVIAVVEHVFPSVSLPAGVVRLVCGIADADLALQFPQVTPRLIILQIDGRIS